MKLRLCFKTPDVLDYAIENLDENEQNIAREVAKKWIKYGECCSIEIDTDTGTATVLSA